VHFYKLKHSFLVWQESFGGNAVEPRSQCARTRGNDDDQRLEMGPLAPFHTKDLEGRLCLLFARRLGVPRAFCMCNLAANY
jgi:hypothetical protein